ncbi:hypothetical protein [uncultured Rhodospira sp.]|uniref:hypothetical protein n=1 Tax=uncultured Rhodospira sp. TaxID=1936189 RepID=UPI00262D82C7|nr:hypothetical protein [uncultured Rhodospira sp.]
MSEQGISDDLAALLRGMLELDADANQQIGVIRQAVLSLCEKLADKGDITLEEYRDITGGLFTNDLTEQAGPGEARDD